MQQAVVVLQAREVLATLLISWPRSGPRLNTTFLGGLDPTQYLCLLDLLSHHQPEEQRKKVHTPSLYCEPEPVGVSPPLMPPARCSPQCCSVGRARRWWAWLSLQPSAWGRCVWVQSSASSTPLRRGQTLK